MTATRVILLAGLVLANHITPGDGQLHACPTLCACRWKGGKETVDCVGRQLNKVPHGMGSNTQVLDLSRNNLRVLPREIFLQAGVLNLQKIYLSHCKLERIDNSAFSRLHNLVELDLSDNLLISVPTETFVDYAGLRRLVLNNNPIRRIEMRAFMGLPFLSYLEMSSCHVDYVASGAFDGLKNLTQLKLDNNKLKFVPADALHNLKSIQGIDLYANPWVCNCHLKPLKKWLIRASIPHTTSALCDQPERIAGMALDQLEPEEFGCVPEVLPTNVSPSAKERKSASLTCKVYAEPDASIKWLRDGRAVGNASRAHHSGAQVYSIRESGTGRKTSVLTINPVALGDNGEYACVVENIAGIYILNFTLAVESVPEEPPSRFSQAHAIAGLLVTGAIVTIGLVVYLMIKRMGKPSSGGSNHRKEPLPNNSKKYDKPINSTNHVSYDTMKDKQEMKTFTEPKILIQETSPSVVEKPEQNGGRAIPGMGPHPPMAPADSDPVPQSQQQQQQPPPPDVVNTANQQYDQQYNYADGLLDEIETQLQNRHTQDVYIKPTGPLPNGPGRYATLQYTQYDDMPNGRIEPYIDPITRGEYADEQYRQRHNIIQAKPNFMQGSHHHYSQQQQHPHQSTLPRNVRLKPMSDSDSESIINIKTNFINDPTLQNPTPIFMEHGMFNGGGGDYGGSVGDYGVGGGVDTGVWQQDYVDYPSSVKKGPPPPVPPRSAATAMYTGGQPVYGGDPRLKGGMVQVLPTLPMRHFARMRDSPDEGFDDEEHDGMYVQH